MSLVNPRVTVGAQILDNLSTEYWIHYIDVLLSHSLAIMSTLPTKAFSIFLA